MNARNSVMKPWGLVRLLSGRISLIGVPHVRSGAIPHVGFIPGQLGPSGGDPGYMPRL